MISKIIEVTNGFNWGKFMVARYHEEWELQSQISEFKIPLLREIGWGPDHIWVLDLQTGEAACFRPGGLPAADLTKHKIWVCPMFEPFLAWLYQQDLNDIRCLPILVTFTAEETKEHTDTAGYRRPGVVLTPAENEVLGLWVIHLCDKKVAGLLGKAVQTVRNQLAAIEDKFGVCGRLPLLKLVIQTSFGSDARSGMSKAATKTVA